MKPRSLKRIASMQLHVKHHGPPVPWDVELGRSACAYCLLEEKSQDFSTFNPCAGSARPSENHNPQNMIPAAARSVPSGITVRMHVSAEPAVTGSVRPTCASVMSAWMSLVSKQGNHVVRWATRVDFGPPGGRSGVSQACNSTSRTSANMSTGMLNWAGALPRNACSRHESCFPGSLWNH